MKERLWATLPPGPEFAAQQARALEVDTDALLAGFTKSRQALSAHPDWNTNGAADDICDDMFVEVFRRIGPENLGVVRCVCARWQRLVDAPFHALHPPVELPWVSLFVEKMTGRLDVAVTPMMTVEVTDETLLIKEGDVEVSRYDFLNLQGPFLTHVKELVQLHGTTPHAIKRFTIRFLAPREVIINATIAWSVLVKSEILRDHFVRSSMSMLWQGRQYVDATRIPWSVFDRGQVVHEERDDPTLLPKAKLYDHQRHAAAWLKRMEEKVVARQPIARNAFLYRTSAFAGTPWAIDASAPKPVVVLQDKDRPHFEVFSRGVLLGCEVSVGKTHQVCAFLLGCQQHIEDVPDVEPGKIKYTRELDFGGTGVTLGGPGLIVTQAALVIVPNTVVRDWSQALLALRPTARIVTLTDKRTHEKCTYDDIVRADVVLVTAPFLRTGSYYRGHVNLGPIGNRHFLGANFKGRACRPLDEQYAQFAKLLLETPGAVRPDMRAPLLHLFAWPRLVIDEIHELWSDGAVVPEVTGLSARFIVGISATLQKDLRDCERVRQRIWREIFDVRVSGRSVGFKEEPVTELFNANMTRANLMRWTVSMSELFRASTLRANLMIWTAARAMYWRNTQAGVERQMSVAEKVDVKVEVPIHPLQYACSRLLHWCTSRAADVPILMPLVQVTRFNLHKKEPTSFARAPLAGADLTEYPRRFVTMVEGFLAQARDEVAELRKYADDHDSNSCAVRATQIERMLGTLQNVTAVIQDYFAPRIAASVFVDETERLYGTKVSLLFRYLDAIHERHPRAQSMVAVGYVSALAAVFEHLYKQVRKRTYAVLGGRNQATTDKELERFRSGTAKVLLLNTSAASADGANLQRADFVFHLDERTPPARRTQIDGRAARAQRANKVVVFDFRTVRPPAAPLVLSASEESPINLIDSEDDESASFDSVEEMELEDSE